MVMKMKNSKFKIQNPIIIFITVFMIIVFMQLPALAAGGDVIWEYGDTPQTGKQEATAMAVDSAGNTVIIGYSDQSGTGEYYTVKVKSDGSGVLWSAIYNVPTGDDPATDVVIDSDDNVIVTGYILNGINYDYHTIKYDGTDGAVLWQHTFNADLDGNDYAPAAAVDSLNNVYVSGISQGSSAKDDYIIIKYGPNGPNPDGTLIWQVSYNGAADGHDRVASIAAGIDGIAITGSSQNSTPDFDCLTIKYGFDGSLIWEKRYSVSGNDEGKTVRMDSSGNVIMTGTTYNGSNKDIYTVKYDGSTGTVIWEDTYNGGYDEEPADLFVDSFNDVYITGYTYVLTSANDFYTAKYDGSLGTLQWSDTYNSANGNNDRAVSIVVDESGDLFVAGDSYDETLTNYNFLTLKYIKNSGTLLWQKTYNGSAGKDDRVAGIDITSSGEPIVAGWSDMWTAGASDYDYYAIKYDPGLLNPPTDLTATAISTTQIDLSWSDNSSNEDGFKIERKIGDFGTYSEITTVGPNVTTYSNTALTPDTKYYYRVRAYNSTEGDSYCTDEAYAVTTIVSFTAPALTYIYSGPDGGDDSVTALAAGSDNTPVITGYSYSLSGQFDYYTLKLNKDTLVKTWDVRYNSDQDNMDIAKTLAVDNNDDVIVSGYSNLFSIASGGNSNDIYTIKYPSTGPPEDWNDPYNGPAADDDRSSIVAVSKDGSDNYVVVGYGRNADLNDDIYVIKYLSDGTIDWAATPYDSGVMGHDYPTSVAFDSNSDIIVAGYTYNGSDYDYFVRKYNGSNGTPIWTDIYNISGSGNDYTTAISIDSSGNVYVTGDAITVSGNEDFYTIKYDGTNGTRIWEKSFNGLADGTDEAISIGVDPINDEVVIAGRTLAGAGNNEFHVIRYDTDGNVVWERTLDRPGYDDIAMAMRMDKSGNVHVTGNTDSGGDTDVISIMYNYEGSFVDGTIYNGSAGDIDGATAVTVNELGEAFVGGYSINASGNADYLVFKVSGDDLLVPTPFSAVSPDYTRIELTWTDNSTSEDGYRLERKIGNCSSGNPWGLIYDAAADTTSYSDTGLNLGSDYCYRIRTYSNSGRTSRWVEKAVTTLTPQAPGDLSSTNNTTDINLSWTDNTINETGFTIERCTGAGCDFSSVTQFSVGTGVISYLDDTACKSTTYRYRANAYKTGEWVTNYSNIITVTTSSIADPTVLTANRISETQIDLSWTDNSDDETGFEIERCTGTGCSDFGLLATTLGTSYDILSYWKFDEGSDTTANDSVSTYNGTISGATWTAGQYGNALSFDGDNDYVDFGDINEMDSPGYFSISLWFYRTADQASATNHDINNVLIAQSSNAENDSFEIGTQGTSIEIYVNSAGGLEGNVSYDAGIQNDTWYHLVITYNKDESNELKLFINGNPAAEWSDYSGNLDNSSSSPLSIGIARPLVDKWGDFSGIIDEAVIFSEALTADEVSDIYNNGISLESKKYSDLALVPVTSYTYRVKAYKTAICSWETGNSNTSSASTTILPPSGLSASTVNTTQIDLSWTDNTASESGFTVQRCEGAGCSGFDDIGTAAADATSYSDTSICENITYNYRVKAYKDAEWSSGYSNEASAATNADMAPTVLTITFVSESQADLEWTDNSDDETGFEVQRCTGNAASCTQDVDFTFSTNVFPSADALSYWNFDEGSGITVDDYTGNNDGTVNSAEWTTGKFGGGLSFSSGKYVSVGDPVDGSLDLGTGSFTLEAWIKAPTVTGRHYIISKDSDTNDPLWYLELGNGTSNVALAGRLGFYLWENNNLRSYDRMTSATSRIDDDLWHHIAAVIDRSAEKTRFYVDGVEQGTEKSINYGQYSAIFASNNDNFEIGRNNRIGTYFSGVIDEVAVHNRVLTDPEILEHYQDGIEVISKYTDTGLTPETAYTYRVRSYKDATCSWQSGYTNSAETTTTAAIAPTDFTADVVSSTQIDLSWTDNTDEEILFRIQRCTGTGCDFLTSDEFTVNSDVTEYSDTSVCEGATYRYRVRAERDSAPVWQSDWSIPTGDVTTDADIAPTDFTATTATETQIDLTWTANTLDETGYKIERCIGSGCSDFTEIATLTNSSDTSLILFMHMDEILWDGTVDEVVDSSTYDSHGTGINGATTVTEGKYGRAGSFDGADDYVSTPLNIDQGGSKAYTFEAWVYL
jgi:uncharacterized delta-60 repeat protein